MRDVIKSMYKEVFNQALEIVKTLNQSSAKWLPLARDEMQRVHDVALALYTMASTRWNSMQAMFASLLRVRSGLQAFAATHKLRDDFPPALLTLTSPTFWSEVLPLNLGVF